MYIRGSAEFALVTDEAPDVYPGFRSLFCGGLGEEGEEFGQLFVAGFAAVFADFEGFGVFGCVTIVFSIPEGQFLAVALGDAAIAVGEILPNHLGAALALLGGFSGQGFVAVGAAFEELGFHDSQGVEFLLHHRINIHDDIGLGGIGLHEAIGVVHEDRVVLEMGRVGADERDGDHVGRILHEKGCVAMVGVIVVGAGAEDQVGLPFADEADQLLAILERGHELAVVIVEDFDACAEEGGGLLHFVFAAEGKWAAGFAPVADVAVGDGDEFDMVALGGPESADAAGLELAVVGVGAEADDAEFAVVGGSGEGH
jgi:hypothetical protein